MARKDRWGPDKAEQARAWNEAAENAKYAQHNKMQDKYKTSDKLTNYFSLFIDHLSKISKYFIYVKNVRLDIQKKTEKNKSI